MVHGAVAEKTKMILGEDAPDGQEKSRNRQLVIDSGALLTSSPVKKIVAEQLDSKNAEKQQPSL